MGGSRPFAPWEDAEVTADGAPRARVRLSGLRTLWFATGSLCNLACRHCYMGSGPRDHRLTPLARRDVGGFLDEVEEIGLPVEEVGFTGGEPFVNPAFPGILDEALGRGFQVLVLTNATRPMQRARVRRGLVALRERYGPRLTLRVSLDHYTPEGHEGERGPGSWETAIRGLTWLAEVGFRVRVAGRTRWKEAPEEVRLGYGRLLHGLGLALDARDPEELVLFPEMNGSEDVPEITTACWGLVGRRPSEMMCARSRMVLRRRGEERPVVVACTLLPYDRRFELGASLAEAERMVPLLHPRCAAFCVLGVGACDTTAPADGPSRPDREARSPSTD